MIEEARRLLRANKTLIVDSLFFFLVFFSR